MTKLETSAGIIITQAQLVAISTAAVVFVFLVIANLVVCRLYSRAAKHHVRQEKKKQRKKSDVWIYHVYRTNHSTKEPTETVSEKILKKLRASHDNLQAAIEAEQAQIHPSNTLGHDECQALEELEVTADLFLHDTSLASSRRSSMRSSSSYCGNDIDVSFSADLDAPRISADVDLGELRELDKVSVSSVTMADFQNDPAEFYGNTAGGGGVGKGKGRKKPKRRWSSRKGGEEESATSSSLPQTIPVAEFHNEAFDFTHENSAAIERVKDVEL